MTPENGIFKLKFLLEIIPCKWGAHKKCFGLCVCVCVRACVRVCSSSSSSSCSSSVLWPPLGALNL
jgi:hypothetical protein